MRPTGSTLYYFCFILFLFSNSYAQVFPMQGSLQITPPYTPYLSDYTTAGEQKLTLQLRPNDITLGDHPVRLRLTIEGVGITIRTRANYIPPTPHTLMGGGAPTLLYGDDLIDYFNPDNLDFAGFSKSDFQQSGKLPEGVYRFSFEVLDYYRQVSLSSKIMTVAWIVLNDPPLLNLPLNNTKVTIIDPTNIAFTWTPRHTSSPNSAFTTEYVFKIVEVWPVSRNAYDAFLSQPALYETTLTESQLIYGPSEPALLPGHKYAWQVQARDDADRDVFKNQGKSEVFVFQFGDLLGIPENLHEEGVNDQALTLAWEPAVRGETPALYHIRYKAASAESWSEILSDKQWLTLTGLKPNTDYEVQVRGKLDDVYSDYTPLLRAKTAEKAANFVCGQPPATVITDKTSRLLQLTPGDIFTCNDWRIVVREASRSTDGEFSGKGLMAVKMFAGASIEVAFHGAINAGYQLITGGVESLYNKGSEMGSVVEEMKKIGEKKKDTTKTNIDSLPLPQLQELAQSLIDIPQEKIDKALVLNREEKQQINGARTKAKEALKTLNDPKATDKEKKEAEKNLRKVVTDAKPAMDKLTNSDKDKQSVADRWFKRIMDFLNAYKGDEADKKQAIVWHNKMDSTVNVLSNRKEVPATLKKAMVDAHQNAGTAWANLEKGTDGIRPRGPSADFEEGHTPEDIALCKENAKTVEAVENYIRASAEKGIVNNQAGNYMTPDKRLVNLPAGAEIFYNCENENKFQNTGYLYKFRADNKIWQTVGTEHLGSGFQFEKYTSGGEQYTIGALAKEGDEVWRVTQTLVQNQRTLSIQKKKLSNTTAYGNIFEMSAGLSEEKSIPVTSRCDNNSNSNAAANTTTIPEPNGGGRYDVKVYLEDGKWKAQVTLKGKPHEKTSTQKAAIEAEMNIEIAEKLNELEGLNGKRSRAVTAQPTEDNGEFWVKDMDGLEWLHTICDLGGSVWETAALPKKYWDKDEGYQNSTIHCPPTFAGASDGVVEEVTEYQQLIKLAYDVSTKPEVRQGLWNSVKNISLESIKNAAVNFYEERKEKYTSNKPYIVRHTVAKDAVAVVAIVLGLKAIKSILKNVEEGVKTTGKEIAEKGGELVGKYNWGTAKRYFQHIQAVTGRAVPQKQIDKLKEALRAKEYKKLSKEEYILYKKEYSPSRKEKMVKEWETNTGQTWPVDVNGRRYQLHHIIEQQYGGPNEWWNSHPAKFPNEHQGGIHAAGSPSRELFK